MIISDCYMQRIGVPHCPNCGKEISPQSIDQIVDSVRNLPERTKIQIMAPVARGRKGEYVKTFEDARKKWICGGQE